MTRYELEEKRSETGSYQLKVTLFLPSMILMLHLNLKQGTRINYKLTISRTISRWDKFKGGLQRSQTLPANIGETKSTPPTRPPHPKTTPTTSNSSPILKPSRPPPPRVAPRRATVGPISSKGRVNIVIIFLFIVSLECPSLPVSFTTNGDNGEKESSQNKDVKENEVFLEEEEEEEEQEQQELEDGNTQQGLIEIDIKEDDSQSEPPLSQQLLDTSLPDECEQSVSSSVVRSLHNYYLFKPSLYRLLSFLSKRYQD